MLLLCLPTLLMLLVSKTALVNVCPNAACCSQAFSQHTLRPICLFPIQTIYKIRAAIEAVNFQER